MPQFLTAVPVDPMDAKPVRFHALSPGYVIYSLGQDGTDDGGIEYSARPKNSAGIGTGGWDYTFTVAR